MWAADIDMAEKLVALCRPETDPDAPMRFGIIEAHFVFLTRERAYKMKRPVRYAFLPASTRELQRHYCEEELRLNQRLGAEVYLKVFALRSEPDIFHCVGASEWLIHHRERF
jgi:aminoglycoside phosphotransferase family enzyme